MSLIITPAGSGSSPTSSNEIYNVGLTATVAASALTITLTQSDGTALSSGTGAAKIGFRNSTLATGQYIERSITSAISVVIPSGTTIGTVSGATEYIQVYAFDDAGTVNLAVSVGMRIDESNRFSVGAISGGTIRNEFYGTVTGSNVPLRLIGQIKISEATAGTWATAPTVISLMPFPNYSLAPKITTYTSGSGTFSASTAAGDGRTPVYIRVRMVGGGSGGAGSGTGSPGNSLAGGNTTFGTSLLTANGGGATNIGVGGPGVGGTATIGTGASGTAISGQSGSYVANAIQAVGGNGGQSPFGAAGVGSGGGAGLNGRSAVVNSGSGGGGAGTGATGSAGTGGGAGGYIDAIISPVEATYSYAIGTGSTGGSAGTSGFIGGTGGSGYIEVTEYFQ